MRVSFAAIFLALLLTASVRGARAQITLENHYTGLFDAKLVEIEGEGWKYYGIDTSTLQVRIYNTDHSLWRTVTLPIQVSGRNIEILNVSSKLFDTDPDLEFLVKWLDPGPPLAAPMAVVSETAIQHQFTIPGYGPSLATVFKVDNSWKLRVVSGKVPTSQGWTLLTSIYSLPGSLPTSGRPAPGVQPGEMTLFPNPASNEVHLLLPVSATAQGAELIIRDAAGRHIRSTAIAAGTRDVTIPMADLAAGVYNAELRVGGAIHSASQFTKK